MTVITNILNFKDSGNENISEDAEGTEEDSVG